MGLGDWDKPLEPRGLINGWINPIQGIDGSDTQRWPQVARPGSSVARRARKEGRARDNAAVGGAALSTQGLGGMKLSRLLEDLAGFPMFL